MPLDEPGGVVALDEAGHGLAELLHGVVQLNPQALVLQGADPAFGAAVGLGFTQERRVIADPQPGQGSSEVRRTVLRPQSWRSARPRATSGSRRPQRSMTAS
jgi:hypothetical protein